MTFNPQDIMPPGAKIKVIGIGGGGGNAVNTMIRTNIDGVEFVAANTDIQALQFSLAPTKIQVGRELTKGLGAGADPDVGRDAALEDRHAIQEAIDGANMVFITAGMGGGTGTGGAAVIAQIARELGALTVGVVTKPFGFEGKRRMRHAEIGVARLQEHVDTLITIPNQRLLQVAGPDLSMIDAFRMADNVLVNAVRGISDIINVPGTVNVDFADVKTVMSSMGRALMGIGIAEGEDRALNAARQAVCSPLLEDIDIEGATGILINITAGNDIKLSEVNQACSVIQEAAHEDCNIIFGAVIDESLGKQIRVTVIATGFPSDDEEPRSKPREVLVKDAGKSLYQPIKLPDPKPAGVVPPKHVVKQTLITRPAPARPEPVMTPPPAPKYPVMETPVPQAPVYHAPVAQTPVYHSSIAAVPVMTAAPAPQEEVAQSTDDELTALTACPLTSFVDEATNVPEETPALEAGESDDFRLEGARAAREETGGPMFAEEQGFEDDFFAYLEDKVAAAPSTEADSPRSPEDKKIDEALELADRIGQKTSDEADDLDIPAFLRNGIKDLSLS